jgi:hypothetical protein
VSSKPEFNVPEATPARSATRCCGETWATPRFKAPECRARCGCGVFRLGTAGPFTGRGVFSLETVGIRGQAS